MKKGCHGASPEAPRTKYQEPNRTQSEKIRTKISYVAN